VGGFYDEEMRCNGATWKEGKNAAALGGDRIRTVARGPWPWGQRRQNITGFWDLSVCFCVVKKVLLGSVHVHTILPPQIIGRIFFLQ
jgi:hypothetical protein